MSENENKSKQSTIETLSEHQVNAHKSVEKLVAVRAAKLLSPPNSKWTLLQEIAQEIVATYVAADPSTTLTSGVIRSKLEAEVMERYKDEPETQKILLDAIPSNEAIRLWTKKEGWDKEVWKKIHDSGLFTKERRAAMINALFMRGMEKDTVAAKIWLTLSGDYVEKQQIESSNSTVDKFKEINEILHKRKAE